VKSNKGEINSMEKPRIALIGCLVLKREIEYCIAKSGADVTLFWLEQKLHNTPDKLREMAQAQIDALDHTAFDVVVLGYGLCSNGVVGLRSNYLPLIIPRCDDCIALFLGSQKRYLDVFNKNSGIYWYNAGWIEHGSTYSVQTMEQRRAAYAEQFDEDNVEYLMEMEYLWVKNYSECGFIPFSEFDDSEYKTYSKESAAGFGWKYNEYPGDLGFIEALVGGKWDESVFLCCPPGSTVEASFDEGKIKAVNR